MTNTYKKREIDPRTRLIVVLCLTTLGLIFQRLDFLAAILMASVVCAFLLGGMKQFSLFKRWRWFLGFFIIIALMQSIFQSGGEVIWTLGCVDILTVGGLMKGGEFLCRMGIILVSATILAAGGSRKMMQGLIKFKIPYELAFMVSTALLFLPMITEEMKNSLIALQLRGIELKKIPLGQKIRIYSYLFLPVMSGILVKAKELSLAMEMRAFRAYPKRSSYICLRLTMLDYGIITIATMSTIGVLWCGM